MANDKLIKVNQKVFQKLKEGITPALTSRTNKIGKEATKYDDPKN